LLLGVFGFWLLPPICRIKPFARQLPEFLEVIRAQRFADAAVFAEPFAEITRLAAV
jgi:hypothetical protein